MAETTPAGINWGISLIAGVVSSLLAIALTESARVLRQTFANRTLKRVLGLHSESCTLVAPIFNNLTHTDQWSDKLIHYRDAYAFSHLFALCQRIGVEPSIIPYNRFAEYDELVDIFCIGGPVSNQRTAYYLSRYLPGLRMVDASRHVVADWREGGGFVIGPTGLFDSLDEQYAILAKIGEQELGQQRTVHLLFGYGSVGTAAAGYYLWKHFE